jgi:hypothetical protein
MRIDPPELDRASTPSGISPDSDMISHHACVVALIRERAIRARLLPLDWFSDLAWDLMLALYLEHLHDGALSTAAIEGEATGTARQRWLDVIVAHGLAEREPGGARLAAPGVVTMRAYFAALASPDLAPALPVACV